MDGVAQGGGRGTEYGLKLHEALGISGGAVVAFAGAGGKSGAILEIARRLTEAGASVLVVPTTKMLVGQAEEIGPIVVSEDPADLRDVVEDAFSDGNPGVVAGGARISKGRVGGVEPGTVGLLAPLADVVLVEADGARSRWIKGTAEHEPALPDAATLVVAVGNVNALGAPVDEKHVHRPALFSELTGVGPGQSITPRAFARALVEGSLSTVPDGTPTAALITGVGPGRTMSDASTISRELWRLGTKDVVLTSIPNDLPTLVWVP